MNKNRIKLIGLRFGRLVVKGFNHSKKYNNSSTIYWDCLCDCGNHTVVNTNRLTTNNTMSCGCLRKEIIVLNGKKRRRYPQELYTYTNGKESFKRSRIYTTYNNMKNRCTNINNKVYHAYGGRGIIICKEWIGKDGFFNFYNWAKNNGYKDNLTIDRINVNGNYEPNNCRWVTKRENARNTRNVINNKLITYKNETHTAFEWLDLLGIEKITRVPFKSKKVNN